MDVTSIIDYVTYSIFCYIMDEKTSDFGYTQLYIHYYICTLINIYHILTTCHYSRNDTISRYIQSRNQRFDYRIDAQHQGY